MHDDPPYVISLRDPKAIREEQAKEQEPVYTLRERFSLLAAILFALICMAFVVAASWCWPGLFAR